jgi:hypothetical protein
MKTKVFLPFFLFLSIALAADAFHTDTLKRNKRHHVVRGCTNWGFFAEFFWTLNYFEWCNMRGIIPVVEWGSNFAYYSPQGYNGSTNCWEYYFEPVSSLRFSPGDQIDVKNVYHKRFSTIWWYSEYINNLHLLSDEERQSIISIPLPGKLAGNPSEYPVGNKHLYSKDFRRFVKSQLLDRYVRIKSNIQNKIDTFYRENMQGKHVVGLHLRGSFVNNEVGEVPLESLCDEANRHAGPNTVFFIATDQYPLLERVKALLNGEVIFYECFRQETTTSPFSSAQWPPQMAEDVLVETKLLSMCDHFVHTISNVSTAALYFNPDLPHTLLWCGGS